MASARQIMQPAKAHASPDSSIRRRDALVDPRTKRRRARGVRADGSRCGPLHLTDFVGVGAFDSMSDDSSIYTPTPPVSPRKEHGASRNIAGNIKTFRQLCVNKTAELEPQPLRTAGGELASPIKPGLKPAGGFSPPFSPLSTPNQARLHPCIQKTLANHYPVSRLNPMPTVIELVKQHKDGKLTQDELWRSINQTRAYWKQAKCDAEERVFEQQKRREALSKSIRKSRRATSPDSLEDSVHRSSSASTNAVPKLASTGSAPAKLQGLAGSYADLKLTPSKSDFQRDGCSLVGATTSDDRADEILARLRALTCSSVSTSGNAQAHVPLPSAIQDPAYKTQGKQTHSHELFRENKPEPDNKDGQIERTTSRSSCRSCSRGGNSTVRVQASRSQGERHDFVPAVYQEVRPGTKEEIALEEAELTLKRMMTWAMTARHDRTREMNWEAISANPWAQPSKTPEPQWAGAPLPFDSAGNPTPVQPGRVGTPLFPKLSEEEQEREAEFKYKRRHVKTPPPGVKGNGTRTTTADKIISSLQRGQSLYYVRAGSAETRMIWEMVSSSSDED